VGIPDNAKKAETLSIAEKPVAEVLVEGIEVEMTIVK